MGFAQELLEMPFHIINKIVFKDRTIHITFASGNKLKATCPDGNNEYEMLMQESLKKLGKEKVEIYDNFRFRRHFS